MAAEEELQREGQRLPNLTHPDAPIGGEENAAVLKLVGAALGAQGVYSLGCAHGLLLPLLLRGTGSRCEDRGGEGCTARVPLQLHQAFASGDIFPITPTPLPRPSHMPTPSDQLRLFSRARRRWAPSGSSPSL